MQIEIPSKLLTKAAIRGNIGTLSKEVKNNILPQNNPIIACIKIEANDNTINFASSSPGISSLYTIKNITENNIVVKEKGNVFVNGDIYTKLLNNINKEYNVALRSEFLTDKIENNNYPIGKLITVVKNQNEEKHKGQNDIYDGTTFPQINFNFDKTLFTIKNEFLRKSINNIIVAVDASDLAGVLNKIAMIIEEKNIYLACTDGKRCAIHILENKKDCQIQNTNANMMLIDAKILKECVEIFEENEIVTVSYCNNEHIILDGDDTKIKLDAKYNSQFPNFTRAFNLIYPYSVTVNRIELIESIKFLSQYNSVSVIFKIEQNKNNIKLLSHSNENTSEYSLVNCQTIEKAPKNVICLSVNYLNDALKKIKSDNITLNFTEDEKKIKIISPTDPKFLYLLAAMYLR